MLSKREAGFGGTKLYARVTALTGVGVSRASFAKSLSDSVLLRFGLKKGNRRARN